MNYWARLSQRDVMHIAVEETRCCIFMVAVIESDAWFDDLMVETYLGV